MPLDAIEAGQGGVPESMDRRRVAAEHPRHQPGIGRVTPDPDQVEEAPTRITASTRRISLDHRNSRSDRQNLQTITIPATEENYTSRSGHRG